MWCGEIWEERDLEEVYALRYRVYVEEMGRPQRHADHARRRLAEPLDADAIQLAAYRRGATGRELVGALRIHLPDRGDLSELAWLHPAACRADGERTGVVSRLVTSASTRGGSHSPGLQLAREAYRVALRERLAAVEIDCHVSLVGFFEWLGFDVLRRFQHPEYGDVAILRIHPFARERLVASGSPLLSVHDEVARCPGGELARDLEDRTGTSRA